MRSTMLSSTAAIALAALLSLAPAVAGAQTSTDTQTTTETQTQGTDTQTTTETQDTDEGVVTEAEKDAEEGVDAAELIGDSVETPDGDVLGDIETLVVDKDGTIKHIVIGVGGFLGIGEKEVAVAWDHVEVVPEEDRIVANITREELEASPEFDWPEDYQEGSLVTATDDTAATTTAMTDTDGDGVSDADEVDQAADTAAEETEEAADAAADTAEQAADEAADAAEEATDEAAQAVDNAADDVDPVDDAGQPLEANAQFLAGNLIGARILSSQDEDVGEVDDVVLAADGSIQGVITEVGGFLGIDEKQVMIMWDDVEVRQDGDGDVLLHTGLDSQAFEGLENFDYEAARADGTIIMNDN